MDNLTLIREAKKGSAAAQKCLFDAWADRMFVVCCRYVKSREDAEELMLDGFYKFFRSIDHFTYHGDGALHGYLKQLMVRECLMFLRKRNVCQMVTEDSVEDLPLPEESLARLSADEIFKLIVQLPIGYRTVFNLYVLDGMTHHEIADSLAISEGTSKSQLSKAKQLLQKMLTQNEITYVRKSNQ